MEERRRQAPVLFLNAGNALFKREYLPARKVPESRLVAELIVEAYNRMGLDAFNVGAYDLALGVGELLRLVQKARFPVLSANLRGTDGRLLFRPYVLRQVGGVRVGVIGLIENDLKRRHIPDADRFTVDDPYRAAEWAVAEARAEGAEVVVVITDMMERGCRRLARKGLPIQLIVGSARRNQITLPLQIGQTLVTHLDRGGKCLGQVDLWSGDVADRPRGARALGPFLVRNTFVPLRIDTIPEHPGIARLVEETLARVKELHARAVAAREPSPSSECGREFVGARACAPCHPDRYAAWEESPHAGAYATLEARGRQYDPDCLACHAVAYDCTGGEVDRESLRKFTAVQCESCHGPGSAHARTGGQVSMSTELVCPRCHTPDRSPDFDPREHLRTACSPGP